jgi:ATP synthase F1 complex assembly factor 2
MPSPIILKDIGSSKLANVARVKPDGSTGRFFKKVNVVQIPEGWEIEVDGYCVTSKEGRRITFPSEELAVAVAADWEYMHRRVDPKRMPLYTLASLATDMTEYNRQMHRETIQLVFEDDILGPRNESPTPHLEKIWGEYHDPIVEWFRKEYDLPFNVDHLMTTKQPRRSSRALTKGLKALDDWALIGLVTSVDSTLSAITSLALWNSAISVDHATTATRAEFVIQEASWGDVPGNTDLRRAHFLMDLSASTFFLHSIPSPVFTGEWLRSVLANKPDSSL